MKVKLGFKSNLVNIVLLAALAIVVETYLVWWAVNQFYSIGWTQAFAIYIARFLLKGTWNVRKAD